LFYKKTALDPRIQITREEFMDVYELVAHFPIFKLIPNIVDGFKREHLNIEVDQDNDYYDISQSFFGKERALTQIQMNNYKTKAQ